MKEKEFREIPFLKEVRGLPVTFKLFSGFPLPEENEKDLFFYVSAYQGLALAEPFTKPYSKIVKWDQLHE